MRRSLSLFLSRHYAVKREAGDLVRSPSPLLQPSLHHSPLHYSPLSLATAVTFPTAVTKQKRAHSHVRAYIYICSDLSLRHDVDVAVVQGEGHVSEDGASVFDNRQSFILDATVRRTINPDLRQKEIIRGRSTVQIITFRKKLRNNCLLSAKVI